MSRRDGVIVAWHEVPGTAPPQKSRPVGYGVIRAGLRTDSMIGVTKFRIQLIKAGSSAWIHQNFPKLRNFAWQQAMAHSAVVSRRFGPLHRASSSSSNIIGHEPFKKSI